MSRISEIAEGVLDWISPFGRINRETYFRRYLIPVAISAGVVTLIGVRELYLIPAIMLIVGTRKRINDTAFSLGVIVKSLLGLVWVIGTLVAVIATFFMFLGGISGLGDYEMLERAAWVFVSPVALPAVMFVGYAMLVPSDKNESKHGPVPVTPPLLAINTRYVWPALKYSAVATLVIACGVATYWLIQEYQRRDPPLFNAITAVSRDRVEALLRNGADPNQRSKVGISALGSSVLMYGNVDLSIAGLLIDSGADINATSPIPIETDQGVITHSTPLAFLVAYYPDDWAHALIRRLIAAGAAREFPMNNGASASALYLAVFNDSDETVRLLLELGADINSSANEGLLALVIEKRDADLLALIIDDVADAAAIEAQIDIVRQTIEEDGCRYAIPRIDGLLKMAANRLAGRAVYPVNAYYIPPAEQYDPVNFSQRVFDQPVEVLVRQRNYDERFLRSGPSHESKVVGKPQALTAVRVLSMTDVGSDIYRWFRVRSADGQTGFMLGDGLAAQGDCMIGMQ